MIINGVENLMVNINSGTFGFCNNCISHCNCCNGRKVDPAVLTPNDVIEICNRTGLLENDFSESYTNILKNMKTNNGKCYFFKDGKCSIYNFRPIDCRIFPFDVRYNNNGVLNIVWYTSACPVNTNSRKYKDEIKPTFQKLRPFFNEFALHASPLLDKQKYEVVEEISL